MKIRNLFPLGFVLALGIFGASLTPAKAFLGISIGIAPPPLPVYAQPYCPGAGYIWTPGYWAWDASYDDYYWVPGTWVLAPDAGYLWTPGWWACDDGAYFFHAGYWGPHVGFYGGIAYGHGYNGYGYDGGYWRSGHFFYNRSVNNVTNIDRSYIYSKAGETRSSRVSFNGGRNGIAARPTADQVAAEREHHVDPTSAQVAQVHAASGNSGLRYATNHGHPAVLATERAGEIRPAAPASATAESHRTTTESGVTGESHVAATTEREHAATVSAEQRRSLADSHRTATEARAHRHPEATGSHAAQSHAFATRSHAPAYRAAPAARGAAHAPAAHAAHADAGRRP